MMRISAEQSLQRILATKGLGAFRVAKKPPTLSKTLRNKLYVFDNYGKTIVAPNRDDLPPILAEYDSGKTPPELKWWLNELAAAVDGGVMTKAPAKAPEVINIEPLLGGIKWGQRAPWWQNLKFPHPTKEGARCYCVTGHYHIQILGNGEASHANVRLGKHDRRETYHQAGQVSGGSAHGVCGQDCQGRLWLQCHVGTHGERRTGTQELLRHG